jgi:hypothetical protein
MLLFLRQNERHRVFSGESFEVTRSTDIMTNLEWVGDVFVPYDCQGDKVMQTKIF